MLPNALTIAGFDPSGGAGVLADAKTFAAFGLNTQAVITSITYQNTTNIFGVAHQSAEAVRNQLTPLLGDSVVCVKTGMLPTREIVDEVARLLRETNLPAPVVDPVIISSSGQRLMEEEALEALVQELFPLAHLVTPNIPEAERLTGLKISSESGMRASAAAIRKMGARAVLVKGGHLNIGPQEQAAGAGDKDVRAAPIPSGDAVDVLDNEGKVTLFRNERFMNVDVHGTGCMLSAAIAAGLGNGMTLEVSVAAAKQFVFEFIRSASQRT